MHLPDLFPDRPESFKRPTGPDGAPVGIDGTGYGQPDRRAPVARCVRGDGDLDYPATGDVLPDGTPWHGQRGDRASAEKLATLRNATADLPSIVRAHVALATMPQGEARDRLRGVLLREERQTQLGDAMRAVFASSRLSIDIDRTARILLIPVDRKRRTVTTEEGSYTIAGPDYGEALSDAMAMLWQRYCRIALPAALRGDGTAPPRETMPSARLPRLPFAFLRRTMFRLADRAGRAARKRTVDTLDTLAALDSASMDVASADAVVAFLRHHKLDSAADAVAKRTGPRAYDRKRRGQRWPWTLTSTESTALGRAERAIRSFLHRPEPIEEPAT